MCGKNPAMVRQTNESGLETHCQTKSKSNRIRQSYELQSKTRRHKNLSRIEGTRASQNGLLDRAIDPSRFNAEVVDPTHSSRDMSVNLSLQLIRRES